MRCRTLIRWMDFDEGVQGKFVLLPEHRKLSVMGILVLVLSPQSASGERLDVPRGALEGSIRDFRYNRYTKFCDSGCQSKQARVHVVNKADNEIVVSGEMWTPLLSSNRVRCLRLATATASHSTINSR